MKSLSKNQAAPHSDSQGSPVRVEGCTVISVQNKRWTVSVMPDARDKAITNVPVSSLYENPDGSGVYFLPDVGAHGYLMYVGKGSPIFFMGSVDTIGEIGYRGNKRDLRAGDIALVSSSGSRLIMRKGGVIELVSTSQLFQQMLPSTDKLFTRAENEEKQLMGFTHIWAHNRDDGIVIGSQKFKDNLGDPYKLYISEGYHEDGDLLNILYTDPTVEALTYTGHEETRKVFIQIGDLGRGTGRRFKMDIDDGMFVQSIGEKTDGTVLRQEITDHKDRDWRETTDIGLQADGVVLSRVTEVDDDWTKTEKLGLQTSGVVHSEVVEKKTSDWTITRELGRQSGGEIFHEKIESISGSNVVETKIGDMAAGVLEMLLNTDKFALTIKDDGQLDMSINAGALTIQIDAAGNMTMSADGNVEATVTGHTHLTCSDIKLGSGSSGQQLVLGNLWMAHYNAFIAVFNAHQHVGNMGAPTGPPLTPGTNMTTAQLSDKSRTEK